MTIIPDLKTCKKGLHQYNSSLKRCPTCLNEWTREWRRQNPERANRWHKENPEYGIEYRKRNSAKITKRVENWQKENKTKVQENRAKWRCKNIQKSRDSSNHWKKNNKDKVCASTARYKAAKIKATPPWANEEAIKEIYFQCQQLSDLTGIDHEVDHIYPLNSAYMCGLHVENNLQILTTKENRKKGNRYWPGQLDCQKELRP